MAAAPAVRLWHLESFTGGLDRRDGNFTKNQNRFYDLVNCRILNNKRVKRRPPCLRNATQFTGATAGCIEWRGALYTVAKKGDVIGKPSQVTGELRFDNPDHCTTWELIELRTFGGVPVALIKHTYPGGVVTHQYRLHVFDGKKNKPTYVEDPWCPIGWGPTLPLHLNRTGDIGAFDPNWVPTMREASGRLYISRPDGNLAFCKTGNARVWNDRTVEDLQDGGEWWYFFTNATSGLQEFVISEEFAKLAGAANWSSASMEFLDTGTTTWIEFAETGGVPAFLNNARLTNVASRFGGADEIKLQIYWTAGAGNVIRVRLMTRGRRLNVTGATIENQKTFKASGTGAVTVFEFPAAILDPMFNYGVYVGGVVVNRDANDPPAAGLVYIDINAANNIYLKFGTAPAAGTNNITLRQNPYVKGDNTITIEYAGVTYVIPPSDQTNKFVSYRYSLSLYGPSDTSYVRWERNGSPITSQFPLGGFSCVAVGTDPDTLAPQARGGYFFSHKLTTDGKALPDTIMTNQVYRYLSDTDNSTEFFAARALEYQLNLAGADDAGDLPTSSQQGSDGGYVTALSSLKDRLLVSYRGGTQLWQVSGLPEEHALLGFGPVGTGEQVRPLGAVVGQSVILGMARGLMSLNLSGSNLDSLRDINLGEPIEDLGRIDQFEAAFWPKTGQYVTAVQMLDNLSAQEFLVFDYSPEQKINAWNRWTVADLPGFEVNSMVAVGDRLYFRAGGYLHWFDLAATDYIDVYDDPETPYESLCQWHFNHFEAPFRQKQAVAMEWVIRGAITAAIRWNPDMPDEETGEVVYSGMSPGRAKIPVAVWGAGLAPLVRSRDRTGFELEEIGIWFLVRGR